MDFLEAAGGWSGQGRELGRDTFREVLNQPGLKPSENCLLLEQADKVQGFCLVSPELLIGRTVLDLKVARPWAGGSLEREALRWGIVRSTELGAHVTHLCLDNYGPRATRLEEVGFSQVRAYRDMVWHKAALPEWKIPPGFSVRSFQSEDAAMLTEVQNAAFARSWGFCPNTVEQIIHRTSMANTSHRGILFLFQGEKPAGYCWTCISPVDNGIRGVIGMIGIVPEFRGRGISHTILLAGMEYLRSIDVADIGLQVDASNTPAIRLYTSVGFEAAGDLYWFERGLEGAITPIC